MKFFETIVVPVDLTYPNFTKGQIDNEIAKIEANRNCKEIKREVTIAEVTKKGFFKDSKVLIVVNSTFELC